MKNVVSGEFWPVTAQVIPVLALATVLEARAIIQKWPKETPRILGSILGATWTVSLILLALTEFFAFLELADRRASTGAWVNLAQVAIALSLSVLVVNPALDLFLRSNAWIIVRGFFQVSSIISRRKIRQSLRDVDKKLAQNCTHRREAIAWLERVDTFEQRIHEFGDIDASPWRRTIVIPELRKRPRIIEPLTRYGRFSSLCGDKDRDDLPTFPWERFDQEFAYGRMYSVPQYSPVRL